MLRPFPAPVEGQLAWNMKQTTAHGLETGANKNRRD